MARTAKLKVYRTAIGFHDAYVAAPSKKAALEAWGTDKDLFARGAAELVDDEALTADPLAAPGTVIKRIRGRREEQLAALPPDRVKPKDARKPPPKPQKKRPRPSRAALDRAEQALAESEQAFAAKRQELARREAALAREKSTLRDAESKASERLEAARDRATEHYRTALDRWGE